MGCRALRFYSTLLGHILFASWLNDAESMLSDACSRIASGGVHPLTSDFQESTL